MTRNRPAGLRSTGGSVCGKWLCGVATVLMLFALEGCSQPVDGPTKYSLTGTVTFDGKPIPKGFITISPDTAKGNSGPGTGAPIVDGKFQTPEGKGHVGGAHIIEIIGYDGVPTTMEGENLPDGTPLVSGYSTSIELPKEDGTKDIAVPKEAPAN